MTFAEGALAVTMGEIAAHSAYLPDSRRIPALVERGNELAPQLIAIVEQALSHQPYIVGEIFTAADIMLAFALNIARHLDFVNESTPNCLAYCQRLEQRPAYLRACQH
jgi:glutathione S-transferase